jgi:hypothetical protein
MLYLELLLPSPGFKTPGGLATTSVMLENEPLGSAVTMTVVNSGGMVTIVEPTALVVVNDTAVESIVSGGTEYV